MYIDNVRITARDNTVQVSDVEVSLKQLRFASIQIVPFDKTAYQGRLAQQKQKQVNIGKGATTPTPDNVRSELSFNTGRQIPPV